MTVTHQKRRATVSAQQLPGAVQGKIADANMALIELRRLDSPWTQDVSKDYRAALQACMEPARGVVLTIQTFGEEALGRRAFWDWVEQWERSLSPAELAIWELITEARDWQTHGAGPELIEVPIRLDPSTSRSVARFKAQANRPASDACNEYVELVRRFAADFQRNHAALL